MKPQNSVISRAATRISALLLVCAAALCIQPSKCLGTITTVTTTDLSTYHVDGDLLTKNWDVYYLGATSPVTVIDYWDMSSKQNLVSGPLGGYQFNSPYGAHLKITLPSIQLVSAVGLTGSISVATDLEVYTSTDDQTYNLWSGPAVNADNSELIAPNIARLARYIKLVVPCSTTLTLNQLYVYGENTGSPDLIGGIYPSVFPPVVNTQCTLRAVIRNTGTSAMSNVAVEFRRVSDNSLIGTNTLTTIGAGQAAVASVAWTPTVCDPTDIKVVVGATNKTKTIYVVNRTLYFGCWEALQNERHSMINLYTAGSEVSDYWEAKLRGKITLNSTHGDTGIYANLTYQQYVDDWLPALTGSFRDGIAMDEWGYPVTNAYNALQYIYGQRGTRLVVPWEATTMTQPDWDGFVYSDLVLQETYCNMFKSSSWPWGHNGHRRAISGNVNCESTLAGKCLIALGYFVDSRPTIPAELDREVAFTRVGGRWDFQGVVFYGSTWRPSDTVWDALCYKYFIAPVIHTEGVSVGDGTATVGVKNYGGMNAHNVKVYAYSGGQVIATQTIPTLAPDETISAIMTW